MRKDDKHKHFIKEPVYKGGLKALRSFITAHLKYPSQALAKQKTGTVLIRYTINYKGQVVDAKVIKKLGYGCDEEAIRLVKLLKFKIEKTRRVKVQFHKQIQIHFKPLLNLARRGLGICSGAHLDKQASPKKQRPPTSQFTSPI